MSPVSGDAGLSTTARNDTPFPRRILFGTGGDLLGQCLPVRIAQALPAVQCRFVGQLWTNGHFARQAGLDYRCWSWALTARNAPHPWPNFTDFQIRRLVPDMLSEPVRRSQEQLSTLVARELDEFQPDAVVGLTAETSLSYLLDRHARARGVVSIGLQTTFMRTALLVHDHGMDWWRHMQQTPIPVSGEHLPPDRGPSVPPGLAPQRRLWRAKLIWAGRLERTLRALVGAPSFDTIGSMFATLGASHTQKQGGFIDLGTPDIGEQPPAGLVLVALHRPVLQNGEADWVALLRFALAATPAHLPLVVRPHPDEPEHPLPPDLEQALRQRGVQVSRPGHGAGLEALVRQARAVLTINSAVGMQALQAGVPVVAIGPAFYARPGMASWANWQDPGPVRALMVQDRLPRPDAATVQSFARWVTEDLSAPMPPLSVDAAPAYALADRIIGCAQRARMAAWPNAQAQAQEQQTLTTAPDAVGPTAPARTEP